MTTPMPEDQGRTRMSVWEWILMLLVSVGMVGMTWFQLWSLGMTEVLGFVTGGVCVWLVVREHMANWPIGLANNIFFFVLFLSARIYADMTLQVVYFGLGIYGWWNWLYGGPNRHILTISKTTRMEWISLIPAIPLATWALMDVLIRVKDSAPFLDSTTTILSLAAQFLLCRKRLENWFFWIAADLIYVPMYLGRGLPLTATLYGGFLVMCLFGLYQWRGKLKQLQAA
jgi:nicotinamide mononucleotide transporter